MKNIEIGLPIVAGFAMTRALGGAGLALLLADRLGKNRKTVGWTLFGIGLVSTAPFVMRIFGNTDFMRSVLGAKPEERVLHS